MNEINNQLFCKMGEIARDGYFIYNTKKEVFNYLNKAFAELLDLDFELFKEHPRLIIPVLHPEDLEHAKSCMEECLSDFAAKKYEIRLMINGIEKYVRFCVFPLNVKEGILLCGTVEDITIARQNKIHIEQINAHKNITLEVLSHDLKEPFGLMRLTASAMLEEISKLGNKEMIDSLLFIQEMCERNMKLVRSMVNHEFLKSAVIELKKERADLVWEIRDVIRFYKRSHLRELRDFRFNTSHEKIFLELDSMKFLQVINNLISNAIKFTELNGIIEVTLHDKGETVLISVADDGIGIPNEMKADLFNRGESGLRPGLNGEESGGLGMSIIKSIVEMHGGLVSFESEEGNGTTFYIELPKWA